MRPVAVIGFGGHAKVVASALNALGKPISAFTCLAPSVESVRSMTCEILTDEALVAKYPPDKIDVVLGLGSVTPNLDDSLLQRVVRFYTSNGFQILGFVHPFAWVAPESMVHPSAQIHAGAVIQPGSTIDPFVIVNTKASIDHDCQIGEGTHIAPGVTISGNVKIGKGCHLGTGCTVIQGIEIGDGAMIAAGAVVTRDVPNGVWVKGVPAKPYR
ncbi:MAG: acetyltransferase [Pirellula sp.]|jgi:sugar O-acyltransferase (sialic acid O-acetyltransferase NeuD family)